MKWKYIISWLPGIPIAIMNGLIRTYFYTTFIGEFGAHQLSVLSFVVLFGCYVWIIFPWLNPVSRKESLLIGLVWVLLTVLFEFIFGHYVMGHTWEVLFSDYNLLQGRLWVLVLLWIFFAPFVIDRIRSTRKS